MEYSWENKVVLITGAAAGIGAAVVNFLVNENVKHIAILDVAESSGMQLEKQLNSKHGYEKVKFYKCDVTNEKLFLGIFDTIKHEQGYLDVVINNAALMNDRFQVYKKEIEVNVTAVITGTLKAIELMSKENGGHGGTVINIASIAGLKQWPRLPIYSATKSAVLQFSNCIGLDDHYSKSNVRVLAICFGITTTSLLSPQKMGSFDKDMENKLKTVVSETPQQSAQSAAQGIVDAYKKGRSGSTWLVIYDKPAEDISANIEKGHEVMSTGV